MHNNHDTTGTITQEGGGMQPDCASIVTTFETPTGQVTLIVNDQSQRKAEALSVVCDAALSAVFDRLAARAGEPHSRPASDAGAGA